MASLSMQKWIETGRERNIFVLKMVHTQALIFLNFCSTEISVKFLSVVLVVSGTNQTSTGCLSHNVILEHEKCNTSLLVTIHSITCYVTNHNNDNIFYRYQQITMSKFSNYVYDHFNDNAMWQCCFFFQCASSTRYDDIKWRQSAIYVETNHKKGMQSPRSIRRDALALTES